jgi:hypothetical protein
MPNAMVGHIGLVSHHLRSLLGAVQLTVSCACVCKVESFILMYKQGGFDLLASLKDVDLHGMDY